MHAQATYLPFIVERLFTVFLAHQGAHFKAFKYRTKNPESPTNEHLTMLETLKNRAVLAQDGWLARVWVNYRNAYACLAYGRHWLRQFHAAAMPRRTVFASSTGRVTVQSAPAEETTGGQAPVLVAA
jgi:hypothetical protein